MLRKVSGSGKANDVAREQVFKVDEFDYSVFGIDCICNCNKKQHIEWLVCPDDDRSCKAYDVWHNNFEGDYRTVGILKPHLLPEDSSIKFLTFQLTRKSQRLILRNSCLEKVIQSLTLMSSVTGGGC